MNRVQERDLSLKEAYDELFADVIALRGKGISEEKLMALKERKMNRIIQRSNLTKKDCEAIYNHMSRKPQ